MSSFKNHNTILAELTVKVGLTKFSFIENLLFYSIYEKGLNENNQPMVNMLTSSAKPFRKMKKDLVDLIKPYKKGRMMSLMGREFFQAVRGLGNIVKGLIILASAVITGSLRLLATPFTFSNSHYKRDLKYPFYWMADGLAEIIRGLTQVVASPLTILLKMPIRSLITLIKGPAYAEDNPKIQKALSEANHAMEHSTNDAATLLNLTAEIQRQMVKAFCKGQRTRLNTAELQKKYSNTFPQSNDGEEAPLLSQPADRNNRANQGVQFFREYLSLFGSFKHKSGVDHLAAQAECQSAGAHKKHV
jgi:hypothetical protein